MIAYRVYEINDIYLPHVQRQYNGEEHGWIYCSGYINDFNLAKQYADLYTKQNKKLTGIDEYTGLLDFDCTDEEIHIKKQITFMQKTLKKRAK